MTERVKCTEDDCDNLILPTTAVRTGGCCMPCKQKKEREERQKYIEENRRDIDPFECVNDPVEIITLHHVKRTPDPLERYLPFQGSLEEVYSQLTEFDEARLVELSIQEAENGNLDYIEYICLELAAFRSTNLSKLHNFMLRNKLYYPALIFKDASSEVINNLLNRLNHDSENRNHLLSALAWSGSEEVTRIFSSWLSNPPSWSSDLYIPAHDYSKEAGWELTSSGKVRKLYFERCYPLLPVEKGTLNPSLNTCTQAQSSCKWCGSKLTNLLDIDLSGEAFKFMGLSGDRLKLTTCEVCSCYSESLFMNFDTQGNSSWSEFNHQPEYLPDDADDWERMPTDSFTLSTKARSANYAANEFLPTSFSQIGGMPTWVQDSAYPSCPNCQKTMTFVAQIANEEIEKYGEGTYFMYVCGDCNISATNYQQT